MHVLNESAKMQTIKSGAICKSVSRILMVDMQPLCSQRSFINYLNSDPGGLFKLTSLFLSLGFNQAAFYEPFRGGYFCICYDDKKVKFLLDSVTKRDSYNQTVFSSPKRDFIRNKSWL